MARGGAIALKTEVVEASLRQPIGLGVALQPVQQLAVVPAGQG